jgi:hypothetical protein
MGPSTRAINSTLDTYDHVLPGEQEECAQKVNAILFQTGSGLASADVAN